MIAFWYLPINALFLSSFIHTKDIPFALSSRVNSIINELDRYWNADIPANPRFKSRWGFCAKLQALTGVHTPPLATKEPPFSINPFLYFFASLSLFFSFHRHYHHATNGSPARQPTLDDEHRVTFSFEPARPFCLAMINILLFASLLPFIS